MAETLVDASDDANTQLRRALYRERARYKRAVEFTALAVAGRVRAMGTYESSMYPVDFSAFIRETAHCSIVPGLA